MAGVAERGTRAWLPVLALLATSIAACRVDVTAPLFPLTIGKLCNDAQLAGTATLNGDKWVVRYAIDSTQKRAVPRPDGVLVEQTVLSCVDRDCDLPDWVAADPAEAMALCRAVWDDDD